MYSRREEMIKHTEPRHQERTPERAPPAPPPAARATEPSGAPPPRPLPRGRWRGGRRGGRTAGRVRGRRPTAGRAPAVRAHGGVRGRARARAVCACGRARAVCAGGRVCLRTAGRVRGRRQTAGRAHGGRPGAVRAGRARGRCACVCGSGCVGWEVKNQFFAVCPRSGTRQRFFLLFLITSPCAYDLSHDKKNNFF